MEEDIFFHIPYQMDLKFLMGRTTWNESIQVQLGFTAEAANTNDTCFHICFWLD